MTSTTHIQFERYHVGPWPYLWEEGVGLALSGKPSDAHQFLEIMQREGCSPVATRRILTELDAGRTKFTTVRSHLDFNGIGDALAVIGVTLSVVPPAEPQDPQYDHSAMMLVLGNKVDLSRYTAEERGLVINRVQQTQASMARLPHGFGKFA